MSVERAPKSAFWLLLAADAVVACLTTAWFAWFAKHSFDALHDGVMFKAAVDVADGATLFRDTFTIYGPLTTWIQAFGVLLFGRRLIVVKYATALFYGLTAPLLLRLWRPFLGPTVALVALLAWCLTAPMLVWILIPWASVYALFFQALAGVLVLAAVTRGSHRAAFAAGVAATMVLWCRQPVGVCTSLALAFVLVVAAPTVRRSAAALAAFVAGHVGGGVPVVAILAAGGALHDWWLQNVMTPLSWSRSWTNADAPAGPAPSIVAKLLPALGNEMFPPELATFTWTALPVITVATLVVCGAIVVRRRAARAGRELDPALAALLLASCLGVASWPQYAPITCIRHVYWSSTFMIGVAFGVATAIAHVLPERLRARRVAVVVAACFGGLFGRDVARRVDIARRRFDTLYVDAAGNDVFTGLLLTSFEMNLVSEVRRLAAQYPESQFVATRHFGAIFLTLRPQAFRFLPYEGTEFYPRFVADLTRFAETHDVIFVGSDREAPPPIDADRAIVLHEKPYLFLRYTPRGTARTPPAPPPPA